jgi:hypothetical protein
MFRLSTLVAETTGFTAVQNSFKKTEHQPHDRHQQACELASPSRHKT